MRVAKQVPVPSLVRDHNEFHKAGNVVREILMGCAMGVAFVIPWKVCGDRRWHGGAAASRRGRAFVASTPAGRRVEPDVERAGVVRRVQPPREGKVRGPVVDARPRDPFNA